jgi:hypothetical protein
MKMSDIDTQAQAMVTRARTGFVNVEDILVEAAYRLATAQEQSRWDDLCVNVTPLFAAKFLIRKGVTFATVCRMAS